MDNLQPYRSHLPQRTPKSLVYKDTTTLVQFPGQAYPMPVILRERRTWPIVLGICGVFAVAGYLAFRLFLPGQLVAALSPMATPCVPDTVWLKFSLVKDRVEVFIDEKRIQVIKYGDVVRMDGKVSRSLGGPGLGDLDLSPAMPTGTHTVRVVAFHDAGDAAGAHVELYHRGKKVDTFAPPYMIRADFGQIGEQTMTVTTNMCKEP